MYPTYRRALFRIFRIFVRSEPRRADPCGVVRFRLQWTTILPAEHPLAELQLRDGPLLSNINRGTSSRRTPWRGSLAGPHDPRSAPAGRACGAAETSGPGGFVPPDPLARFARGAPRSPLPPSLKLRRATEALREGGRSRGPRLWRGGISRLRICSTRRLRSAGPGACRSHSTDAARGPLPADRRRGTVFRAHARLRPRPARGGATPTVLP
jgi:hypothetical protein